MDKKGISSTVAVGIVIVIIIVAGVGAYFVMGGGNEGGGGGEKTSVAIVTDIGGRGDLAFNDMAIRGAKMAKEEGYIDSYEVIVSGSETDYLPNLRGVAKKGYDLVVATGFLLTDAMHKAANEYPETNWAMVDSDPGIPENEAGYENSLGLLFKAQQPSALVGALASMLAAHYDRARVGMALGIEIPVLYDFESGYKWGVDWGINWMEQNKPSALDGTDIDDTPKKDRVLWNYTGTFNDTAAGYQAAKTQFGQDAVACYNVGGPIGLGIFKAVKEIHKNKNIPRGKPPFGIGVDSNQDWIKPGYIIASATKRVDSAVKLASKWTANGTYSDKVQKYDSTWIGGLKNNAVGISDMESLKTFMKMGINAGAISENEKPAIIDNVQAMRDAQPDWMWEAVSELETKIRNGEVTPAAAPDKEAIKEIRNEYG